MCGPLPDGCVGVDLDDHEAVSLSDGMGGYGGWLQVTSHVDGVGVGPVSLSQRRGCWACSRQRAWQGPPLGPSTDQAKALVNSPALSLVLELLGHQRVNSGELEVWHVGHLSGAVTRHQFLPDEHCPRCRVLPVVPLARQYVRPVLAHSEGSLRERDLVAERDDWLGAFADLRLGVVNRLYRNTSMSQVIAAYRDSCSPESTAYSCGNQASFHSSDVASIAEAVERLAGAAPPQTVELRTATYGQLDRSAALDPRRLGLPLGSRPGSGPSEFDPTVEVAWVGGRSLTTGDPVMVPASVVYYHGHIHDHVAQLMFETSNGCAAGATVDEASLHGALEVLERDAFLLAWYTRMPMRRVILNEGSSSAVRLVLDRIDDAGFDVEAYHVRTDHELACWWIVAVNRATSGTGSRMVCGAGLSLDPEAGLLRALRELGPMAQSASYDDDIRAAQAALMAADPWAVRTMEDHGTLYGGADAVSRLDFFRGAQQESMSLGEVLNATPRPAESSIPFALKWLVERLQAVGLEVIVAEQPSFEAAAAGIKCVKVIIPDTIPMTFGYHARRLHGLRRLYELPVTLGYASQPLAAHDLNPHPHPFP